MSNDMYDEDGEFAPEKVAASKSFHRYLIADTSAERVCAWKTQDEIAFLTGLGTFSDAGKQTTARTLLDKYERAIPLRANWDGIDREKVSAAIAWVRAKQ